MLEHVGVAGYCTFAIFFFAIEFIFTACQKKEGIAVSPSKATSKRRVTKNKTKASNRSRVMNLPRATQAAFSPPISLSDGFSLFSVSHRRKAGDATNPAKGAVMEVHLSAATASPKICRPSGNTWPSDASGPVI